eukprot:gene2232-3114_t
MPARLKLTGFWLGPGFLGRCTWATSGSALCLLVGTAGVQVPALDSLVQSIDNAVEAGAGRAGADTPAAAAPEAGAPEAGAADEEAGEVDAATKIQAVWRGKQDR